MPLFDSTPRRPRKICFVSGTPADYRLLKPVLVALRDRSDVTVQLIVSGLHLARSHGETWRRIVADGLTIDARAEIAVDADGPTAACTTLGLGLMRFGDILQRLAPHLVVVMAARPEAVAAALAASIAEIKVAHIVEGEGTMAPAHDRRHRLIASVSDLHFVSTAADRQRVVTQGAEAGCVFDVGSLGVECVLNTPLLDRQATLRRLDLPDSARYLLVSFEPTSEDPGPFEGQRARLEAALAQIPRLSRIVTGVARPHERIGPVDTGAGEAGDTDGHIRFVGALGAALYFSAARWAEAVVGNAPSGIVEIPSLAVPSVTIGSRQADRVRSTGVIGCEPEETAIVAAIACAVSPAGRTTAVQADNPYEKPGTAETIADRLVDGAKAQAGTATDESRRGGPAYGIA